MKDVVAVCDPFVVQAHSATSRNNYEGNIKERKENDAEFELFFNQFLGDIILIGVNLDHINP